MLNVTIVPVGTKVTYHGSIEYYHGEMTIRGFHNETVETYGEYSPVRYILQYGPGLTDYLRNVRPESFTVISDEDGHA